MYYDHTCRVRYDMYDLNAANVCLCMTRHNMQFSLIDSIYFPTFRVSFISRSFRRKSPEIFFGSLFSFFFTSFVIFIIVAEIFDIVFKLLM